MRRHPPQPSGSAAPRFQAPLLPVFGERARRRRITVVSWSMVALSVFGLLISMTSVLEDRARSATTTATVTGGETVRSGRYGSSICRDATVTFTVDGRDYLRTSPVDRCPSDGGPDQIEVLYDPNDPENFLTEENDAFAYVAVGLFCLLALVSLGALMRQAYLRLWRPLIDERADASSMYASVPAVDSATRSADEAGQVGSLPPGVTAYRVRREETPRPGSPDALRSGVAVAALAALATLLVGAHPVAALLVFTVAILAVLVASLPPWRKVRGILLALLVIFGLSAVGEATDGGAELLTWWCGLLAGFVLAAPLKARRAMRRRQLTATGASSTARDPRGGRDVGVLLVWRDHAYEYEAFEPDVDLAVDAVRRIGAPGHDVVSVYRGAGRLDVVTSSMQPVPAVFCADRRRAETWRYSCAIEVERILRGWLVGAATDGVMAEASPRTVPRSSRPRSLRITD